MALQVRDHGERHEGDLARGLEEGGQVELLDQSEISMSPPITAHLVIRLAEGDGQGRVSGECLEDGRGVSQRGEQALGALPALVGQEGRVDLDKKTSYCLFTRVSNGSQKFHNHREGLYYGLLLVESAWCLELSHL